MRIRARLTGALALLATLAACTVFQPVEPVPRPPARPEPPAPAPDPEPARPSDASRLLARYYTDVQQSLLAQGLLRRDGGGRDTPFDARILTENFLRIAFYEEYSTTAGQLIARETASRLHRWESPVRLEVEFGATVPQAHVVRDRAAIDRYAARLARLTGRSVETVARNGNFLVLIANEDERRAFTSRLRRLLPGISEAALNTVRNLPRSSYCLVLALDPDDNGSYSQAVAIIRAEHPDLLRLSCIHEEIAQGFGLANDSPAARPSIFNDDEEFALLTAHDELLLRMLYDPRLSPGMTADEARPIARTIAEELVGGES